MFGIIKEQLVVAIILTGILLLVGLWMGVLFAQQRFLILILSLPLLGGLWGHFFWASRTYRRKVAQMNFIVSPSVGKK